MAIKEYLRRVFPGTAEEFCQKAGDAMVSGKRLFVVTANPEILMHAGEDPAIRQLLLAEETAVVPDGISVVKAMNLLGLPAKERITGVDLADKRLSAGRQGGGRLRPGPEAESPVPPDGGPLQKRLLQRQGRRLPGD